VPDCRHTFAGIVAPDDIPVARRAMVRSEPEHGLERDVPIEAPIVWEDKLIEVGVDVLAAQPVIGAEPPALRIPSGMRSPTGACATAHRICASDRRASRRSIICGCRRWTSPKAGQSEIPEPKPYRARNRKFESISLQRGVRCELDTLGRGRVRGAVGVGGGAVDTAPIVPRLRIR
jgi:hypothetical protein